MYSKELIWKCPLCGAEYDSEWRLCTHIGGMAYAYTEKHKQWALSKAPGLDLSSPGTVAKSIRPFVLDEVRPRISSRILPIDQGEQPQLDLVSNLKLAYGCLATAEIQLGDFIIQQLKAEYGDDWWVKGIPRTIREKCGEMCEADDRKHEIQCYLYLVDLKDIIDKRWSLFQKNIERLENFPGKPQFLKYLEMLNNIRNRVMHPLKKTPVLGEDFSFVESFCLRLQELTS